MKAFDLHRGVGRNWLQATGLVMTEYEQSM